MTSPIANGARRSSASIIAKCTAIFLCLAPVDAQASDIGDLLRAYPDFLASIEGNLLIWKDGTRMAISDGDDGKSVARRIDDPDLKDMLAQKYISGHPKAPPPQDYDPGRARNRAFFAKMYGDCSREDVQKNLVDVPWLPNKIGAKVRFSKINGAADQLRRVSEELDKLPEDYLQYLQGLGGTFNCRPIMGTQRPSAHGYGIAIDISTRHAHNWRWGTPKLRATYQNAIPFKIVEIFERHGFIWGGKWYHFDTMHFEFRPELLGLSAARGNATARPQ